jgi:thioredoxin 1
MTHLNPINTLKLAAATALMLLSSWAAALEQKPFSAAEFNLLQQQGKPLAVHFHADWCSTCVNQARSLDSLQSDPQLQGMTVLVVNYDKEKDLRKSMNVRSQSVMVVFKGTQEVSRMSGKTRASDIKATFVKAL